MHDALHIFIYAQCRGLVSQFMRSVMTMALTRQRYLHLLQLSRRLVSQVGDTRCVRFVSLAYATLSKHCRPRLQLRLVTLLAPTTPPS